MNGSVWPLVVFTLVVPMGVGTFLIMAAERYLPIKKMDPNAASGRLLLALACMITLATTIGFFHLGSPLNAFYALGNLRSSWLSREILLTVVFIASLFLLSLLESRKMSRWSQPLALLAALAGIGLVFSMSKVYMLPTIPVWSKSTTLISFAVTSLLLGCLAFISAETFLGRGSLANRPFLRRTLTFSLFLMGLDLMLMFLTTLNGLRPGFIPRLILLLGAATLLFFVKHRAKDRRLIYLAFIVAFLAEGLGRYLFYAGYSRVGL